jgi:long-chain acyl-CoA synthetase
MKLTIFDEISTLPDLWDQTLKNVNPDEVFLILGKQSFSYKQLNALAWCIAAYFFSKNFQKGDKVAIYSKNTPLGVFVDWAAQFVGGISIFLPQEAHPEIIRQILQDAQPKFIFLSAYQLYSKNKNWLDICAARSEIICNVEKGQELQEIDKVTDLNFAIEHGKVYWRENLNLIKNRRNSIKPSDTSTVFYFHSLENYNKPYSFTHKQILSVIKLSVAAGQHFNNQKVFLSILSQAYLLEKVAGFYFPLLLQTQIQFSQDWENIVWELAQIAPTCFVGRPDIFEWIFSNIKNEFGKQNKVKSKYFDPSFQTMIRYMDLKKSNKSIPIVLRLKAKIAHKIVLSKIKKKYFPKLQYVITEDVVYSEKWFKMFLALNIPTLVMSLGAEKTNKTPEHSFFTITE